MSTPPPREDPSLCRCLRSKGMYIPSFSDGKEGAEESTTAVYWCLKTMGMTGPDDSYVAPDVCRRGRGCHEERL